MPGRFSLLVAWSVCACGSSDGSDVLPADAGAEDAALKDGASADATPDAGCDLPTATLLDPAAAAELNLLGDPGATRGVFDVSLAYPGGAPAGAMSYSAVEATDTIRTRIAVSNDGGASFVYVADANQAADITLTANVPECPSGSCAARLIHETSGLLYDPVDPDPSRAWKLFTHSYPVLSGDKLGYAFGYISLFVAEAPEKTWRFAGKAIGWNSPSPMSSAGALTLASSIPELADCLALSEPSALLLPNGDIDLALGCPTLSSLRIVLLRSKDHARTFQYVSTLLDPGDASCVSGGNTHINAAHLFFASGREFLLASPDGPVSFGGDGYRGCLLFEMADVGGSSLKRENGAPSVLRRFDSPKQRFNGACAYAEGASALGLTSSILVLEEPPRIFRSFRTGMSLP